MRKFLDWIKAHPVASGCIFVGAFILLIILMFSGSKSAPAQSSVAVGPMTDTGQNTALLQAQLAAGVQSAAISAQSATDQAAIAAAKDVQLKNSDVSLANIYATADTSKYVATLGAQVEQLRSNNEKEMNDAQVTAAVQIQQSQAAANMAVAGLYRDIAFDNNATSVTLGGLQAAVANNSNELASRIQLAGIAADTSVAMYDIDASKAVSFANINATRDVSIAGINAQQVAAMYGIDANRNVSLAQIAASRDTSLAATYAQQQVASQQISAQLQTAVMDDYRKRLELNADYAIRDRAISVASAYGSYQIASGFVDAPLSVQVPASYYKAA